MNLEGVKTNIRQDEIFGWESQLKFWVHLYELAQALVNAISKLIHLIKMNAIVRANSVVYKTEFIIL